MTPHRHSTWETVALGLVLLTLPVAGKVPVEDFLRPPLFLHLQLSPEGKRLAYVVDSGTGEMQIAFRDLGAEKAKVISIPQGRLGVSRREFLWVNEQRLLFPGDGGLWATDLDGKDMVPLTGAARKLTNADNTLLRTGNILHTYDGGERDWVLVEEYGKPTGEDSLWASHQALDLLRLNTRNGRFVRAADNPGNVIQWLCDREGVVRTALVLRASGRSLRYRENEKAPWRKVPGLGEADGLFVPLGLDETGTRLFVAKATSAGRLGVQLVDLAGRAPAEEIVSHTVFDIFDPYGGGGHLLQTRSRRLLGIHYLADLPRTYWHDPQFAAIQQAVDKSLPERVNRVVDLSRDERQLIIHSTAAQHPGTYYRFDRDKNALVKLADTRPWLDAAKLGPMYPMKFEARDGLTLHGYITMPAGREPKHLPTIIVPHPGPWSRVSWGFDPFVQFLVSRGYAVMQVNYRGSTGYGLEFHRQGIHQIGRAMQHDIEDAARWAIARGLAKPDQLAIAGHGFGGYAAVMAASQTPDLYRCALTIDGISDWDALIAHSDRLFPLSQLYDPALNSDPAGARASLRAVSLPGVVSKLSAPVFIANQEDNALVPYSQGAGLAKALKAAGKPHEFVTRNPLGASAFLKSRIQLYTQIEAFLARHLPAKDSP